MQKWNERARPSNAFAVYVAILWPFNFLKYRALWTTYIGNWEKNSDVPNVTDVQLFRQLNHPETCNILSAAWVTSQFEILWKKSVYRFEKKISLPISSADPVVWKVLGVAGCIQSLIARPSIAAVRTQNSWWSEPAVKLLVYSSTKFEEIFELLAELHFDHERELGNLQERNTGTLVRHRWKTSIVSIRIGTSAAPSLWSSRWPSVTELMVCRAIPLLTIIEFCLLTYCIFLFLCARGYQLLLSLEPPL